MDEVDGLAGPDVARGVRTYRGVPDVAADASASAGWASSLRCRPQLSIPICLDEASRQKSSALR